MPTLSPLHSTSGSERILTDMPDLMEAESFESNQLSGRLSSFQMANTSLSGGDTMGEDDDIEEQAEEEEDAADVFNLIFSQRHNESQIHNRKMQSLFTSSSILTDAKNSEADSIVDANQREALADRCSPESAKEEQNSLEESVVSQQPTLVCDVYCLLINEFCLTVCAYQKFSDLSFDGNFKFQFCKQNIIIIKISIRSKYVNRM